MKHKYIIIGFALSLFFSCSNSNEQENSTDIDRINDTILYNEKYENFISKVEDKIKKAYIEYYLSNNEKKLIQRNISILQEKNFK